MYNKSLTQQQTIISQSHQGFKTPNLRGFKLNPWSHHDHHGQLETDCCLQFPHQFQGALYVGNKPGGGGYYWGMIFSLDGCKLLSVLFSSYRGSYPCMNCTLGGRGVGDGLVELYLH